MVRNAEAVAKVLNHYPIRVILDDLERWHDTGHWDDPPAWLVALSNTLHAGYSSMSVITAAYRYVALACVEPL